MAFEPSHKTQKGKGTRSDYQESSEPNLLPIMNLMVVLIPVLLSAAEFVKIRILDINLPTAATENTTSKMDNIPLESNKLDLIVTVTKKGFYIGRSSGFLSDFFPEFRTDSSSTKSTQKTREPDIISEYKKGFPEKDFKQVNTMLTKLRKLIDKNGFNFPDNYHVTIIADAEIDYQTLVQTIDAVRMYEDEKGNQIDLFPITEIGS